MLLFQFIVYWKSFIFVGTVQHSAEGFFLFLFLVFSKCARQIRLDLTLSIGHVVLICVGQLGLTSVAWAERELVSV